VKTVVVVGTGVAGTSTAAALRSHGYDGRLVLVGDEPLPPYRRTALTKDVIAGRKAVEDVLLKPATWWQEQDVELLTGTTVTALRPGAVELDGAALPADEVVLATGGRARALPGLDGIAVRTAADVDGLLPRLVPGARVLVVGAGLVGLEVAGAALARGGEVVVLEAAPLPLLRVLPPVAAQALLDRYRAAGLDIRLGTGLPELEAARRVADVAVLAIGQEPVTELAEAAGARVRDGVVVDRFGRSWLPGLWAAGDCAAFPDQRGSHRRQEHWHAAMSQGAAVGAALMGAGDGWAEVPWAFSQHLGVDLQVCGDADASDDIRVEGSLDGSFAVLRSRAGRLTGAVTVDRTPAMRDLRRLVSEDGHLDEVEASSR
jgi:NADPH-dependent 2,4-dienoyl-CoA reductase/sulfur reductase-like enzyme